MKPTEQLKEEHKAIKLMLKILDAVCEDIDKNKESNEEELNKIVEFIKIFADKCHHGKEEDLLFPAMEETGVPKEGGPIGVMLEEHNLGRGYVKAMSEAISDKTLNKSKFTENARNYIALLEQHIDKEDNILYQIADMHLSKNRQDELLKKFEEVELEKIGSEKHEEFHNLLHQLEIKYLK